MEGFIVMDYLSEFGQAREQLAKWFAEGRIKSKETIVKGGLDAAETALVDLFKGVNTGAAKTSTPNQFVVRGCSHTARQTPGRDREPRREF